MPPRFKDLPPYQPFPDPDKNRPSHGAVMIPADPKPVASIILQHQAYQLPAHTVDEDTAAKMINMTPGSLKVYRCRGIGPRYLKISGWRICYSVSDLADYLTKQAAALQAKLDAVEALKLGAEMESLR
jgi:hypothetical protein